MGKKSRVFRPSTNSAFKHKCNYCDPVPVNFTPTAQPVGNIVTLIGGAEYSVQQDGSWKKVSEGVK